MPLALDILKRKASFMIRVFSPAIHSDPELLASIKTFIRYKRHALNSRSAISESRSSISVLVVHISEPCLYKYFAIGFKSFKATARVFLLPPVEFDHKQPTWKAFRPVRYTRIIITSIRQNKDKKLFSDFEFAPLKEILFVQHAVAGN